MPTFFHGTQSRFERFTLDFAGRTDMASNGALGVWLTPDEDLARRFTRGSGWVMQVEGPEGPAYEMDVRELRDLHDLTNRMKRLEDEIAHYDALRRDLLDQGFMRIDIVEMNGTAPTVVAVDPDALRVTAHLRVGAPELEDALPSP